MTQQEIIAGLTYLAFQLFLLPGLLYWCNDHMQPRLTEAELNFVFYMVNFLAMLILFRVFLRNGFSQVLRHPASFCQGVILGLCAYFACRYLVTRTVSLLVPGFVNLNDAFIVSMGNPFLVTVGTVLLVPPYEECIYRGLIFRTLYSKNRWAAYLVSIFAFAAIHILGYLGQYSPLELLIALLEYLPAGLCLAWAFQKTDTIFAPIVMHAIINYISLRGMR